MKKLLCLLLLTVSVCNAQVITQSLSQELDAQSFFATECINSYYRSFNLNDFEITPGNVVTHVEVAFNRVEALSGTAPVTIKLYDTQLNFPEGYTSTSAAGYTLIAEETFSVPNQDYTLGNSPIVSFPITAAIPLNHHLVAEVVFIPDGQLIFIGMNSLGEAAPSYFMAPCSEGFMNPLLFNMLDSNNENLLGMVMNVVFDTDVLANTDAKIHPVTLYPNPTSGAVTINLPVGNELKRAAITDVSGKTVVLPVQSNTADISALAQGVYVLTLYTTGETFVKKVIKQ